MNRENRGTFGFLVLLAALMLGAGAFHPVVAQAPVFSQDLTLKETTNTPGMMGQPPRTATSTSYFSRNALKRVGSDGSDTIIQFDSGKIITIDNKKKTYSEMTAEQLQQMMEKATAGLAGKKEEMEMMRKMMGQTSDSITVTKEGPGETIAGYATVKYRVTGMMEMEIWAAPELKVPGLYYDAMKFRVPPNPLFDVGKLYDEFKKIEGMTLKSIMTIRMMGNEMKTTTVVDSVEKAAIAASVFEIPAGYKQVAPGLGK